MIGQALVPYYRQILPVLNIFIRRNSNMGDSIDYGQQKRQNLGEYTVISTTRVLTQLVLPFESVDDHSMK